MAWQFVLMSLCLIVIGRATEMVNLLDDPPSQKAIGEYRARHAAFVHGIDLDSTTLGKSGHPGGGRLKGIRSAFSPSFSPVYPRAIQPLRVNAQFKPSEYEAIKRGDPPVADWDTRGGTYSRYPPDLFPAVYAYLMERGLKLVTQVEAQEMVQREGAAIVDVRPSEATIAGAFDRGSIVGSLNVPFVRKVQAWSPFEVIKRGWATFFGIEAVERNPDFEKEALEKLPDNSFEKPIIIVDDMAAKIEKDYKNIDFSMKLGYKTRALQAAYELYQLGFNNLYVLEGGIDVWEKAGLPMDIPESRRPIFQIPAR